MFSDILGLQTAIGTLIDHENKRTCSANQLSNRNCCQSTNTLNNYCFSVALGGTALTDWLWQISDFWFWASYIKLISNVVIQISLSLSPPPLLAVGVLGYPASVCSAGGDGSSGCSLPVRGHPDSPHVAAAAGRGWRGVTAGPERQPAQPAGLPLALPLQTRHQPQDHALVSHMCTSSYCCCRVKMSAPALV